MCKIKGDNTNTSQISLVFQLVPKAQESPYKSKKF